MFKPRLAALAILALSASPSAHATPPATSHPRFLIGPVKAALAQRYAASAPQITAVVAKCDAHASETIASGYQGWDWVDQMSACAIAFHATNDAARGALAVKYWRALLDDQQVVGDGQGGATGYNSGPIVSQDSGYSMRTFGVYSALGLDWLYDAPGVDASLRAHAVARLKTFTDWYAAHGYLNDVPASNYFAGYFLAVWASAIAVGTDDPQVGPALWNKADQLTTQLVVPAMNGPFKGGDWLEGWEYGELASASYCLAGAAAFENGYAAFADTFAQELVMLHAYALRPDGSFIDSGDHQDHPVIPGTAGIWGALVVSANAPWSDYGREYLGRTSAAATVVQWAQTIAEAKSSAWSRRDWSSAGLPLSYYAAGTRTFIARSGWTSAATWASLKVSAPYGADHQHADCGHFEFERGADSLIIDSSDYYTWATWNHNTLLFDDQGRNSVYAPNQGAWGSASKIAMRHVADVGLAAYAQAEFADAYTSNTLTNSVRLARRDWVYVRPDILVVSDRTQADQANVKTTFALHTSGAPTIAGQRLVVDIGASRLQSLTLLPASATRVTVNEPVSGGSAPWTNNDTYAPAFRAEESSSGSAQGSFLHVISATPAHQAPVDATVANTDVAHVIHLDGSRVVVVPAAVDGSDLALPLTYTVPTVPHEDHVVVGLSGTAFSVATSDSSGTCSIVVSNGSDSHVISAPSVAAFHLDGCLPGDAGPQPPVDAGSDASQDAGQRVDGGALDDAGQGVFDGGPTSDAGAMSHDGGTSDAGNGDGSAVAVCGCSFSNEHSIQGLLTLDS